MWRCAMSRPFKGLDSGPAALDVLAGSNGATASRAPDTSSRLERTGAAQLIKVTNEPRFAAVPVLCVGLSCDAHEREDGADIPRRSFSLRIGASAWDLQKPVNMIQLP